jgi:hypothetical protein
VWISAVAELGYVLPTCDLAITRTPSEREAVRRSAARLVGFSNGEYDGWEQTRAITGHWDALARELAEPGRVIVKVYAGSTPPDVERL